MTSTNESLQKNLQTLIQIINTVITFMIGLLFGIYAFFSRIIHFSSKKIFIVWDYGMDKMNRKKIIYDLDNVPYAVNYFILFPPEFKSYFNLVICKLEKNSNLNPFQFKTIVSSNYFTKWNFFLLTRKLCITNEDKSKVIVHRPGFYIKSTNIDDKNKDIIMINKQAWCLIYYYDIKNKSE